MKPYRIAAHSIPSILALAVLGCAGHARPTPGTPPTDPALSSSNAPKSAAPPHSVPSAEPTISGTGDPPPPEPPLKDEPTPQPDGTPVPKVNVTNIGLHVGGGPNDAATKAPFEHAIQQHFDDFKRCYGKIQAPSARGTFGIDLLIDKEGGHPKTSGSRTALPGDSFRDCVAHAFETVLFDKPRHGATKISYALKFEPEP